MWWRCVALEMMTLSYAVERRPDVGPMVLYLRLRVPESIRTYACPASETALPTACSALLLIHTYDVVSPQ